MVIELPKYMLIRSNIAELVGSLLPFVGVIYRLVEWAFYHRGNYYFGIGTTGPPPPPISM